AEFLALSGRSLEDVYRPSGGYWTELRRLAGFAEPPQGPDEEHLGRAVGRLRHIADDERHDLYTRLLRLSDPPDEGKLSIRERRLVEMLLLGLWGTTAPVSGLPDGLQRLWTHAWIRAELAEML